jgi:hypothetical protein
VRYGNYAVLGHKQSPLAKCFIFNHLVSFCFRFCLVEETCLDIYVIPWTFGLLTNSRPFAEKTRFCGISAVLQGNRPKDLTVGYITTTCAYLVAQIVCCLVFSTTYKWLLNHFIPSRRHASTMRLIPQMSLCPTLSLLIFIPF